MRIELGLSYYASMLSTNTRMSICFPFVFTAAMISLLSPLPLYALPGETDIELKRRWRAATHILPRPKAVRQLTDGYPDLSSQGRFAHGDISFSVFLNDENISTSETIDYRPYECNTSPYRCSGQVIFQKSANNLGHLIIAEVFGADILNDFRRSVAVKSIKDRGTNFFYTGQRFNYTTWVYSEPEKIRYISHFTVIPKNDYDLRHLINLAETCANPKMKADPLCFSP